MVALKSFIEKIGELTAEESLENILNALPDGESEELQQDLRLLGLIWIDKKRSCGRGS